jgi:hypothetical protein
LAIAIWLDSLDRFGSSTCLQKSKFKSYREQYICALFALGLSKETQGEYWIRTYPDGTTPDGHLMALTFDTQTGWGGETSALEIFEWEAHSDHTLIQAIKKKLLNKLYPRHYSLLCYIHDKISEIDIGGIFDQLKTINASVGEIWLLANNDDDLHESDYHGIAKLYPDLDVLYFNAFEEREKRKEQVEIIAKLGDSYFLGNKTCSCKNCHKCFLERFPLLEARVHQNTVSQLMTK